MESRGGQASAAWEPGDEHYRVPKAAASSENRCATCAQAAGDADEEDDTYGKTFSLGFDLFATTPTRYCSTLGRKTSLGEVDYRDRSLLVPTSLVAAIDVRTGARVGS